MRQAVQLILAAIVVLVLGYLGYGLVFPEDAAAGVTVVTADGVVTVADGHGDRRTLTVGDPVAANHSVEVGEGSRAVLGMGEGSTLEIEASSSVRVVAVDETGVRVELEQGRVSARVRAGSTPLGLSSRGRAIYADDADFTLAVDEAGALALQPERGSVRVEGFGDSDGDVSAGSRLSSLPGQPAVIGDVPSTLLLEVGWPEAELTRSPELVVEGRTDPYAEVRIGSASGEPGDWTVIRAGPKGHFRATIALAEGENAVQLRVRDAMGNELEDQVSITRDSTAPSIGGSEVQWGP